MSTDVQLFKGGIPAYLKAQPLNDITKSLLGSTGKTTKRISIRGNVFRLVANGKEIATSDERSMNVVIVNASPKVHRTFYAGAFDPNAKVSPTCWSADGERPDQGLSNPQSDACSKCPQNIAGSGQGNTKACKFGRMLAVVLENDLEGDVFQLSLPSQSIFGGAEDGKMPLNAYTQFLAGFNVNVTAVVTEMRFDTSSATPKLFFKAIRPLNAEEYDMLTQRSETPEVTSLVTVSFKETVDGPPSTKPKLSAFKAVKQEAEPEDDTPAETAEPVKKATKKAEVAPAANKLAAVMDQWDDE